jgi:hypothetical protein
MAARFFSAATLALLDMCDAIEVGTVEIDKDVAGKLMITVAHDGFLTRLK